MADAKYQVQIELLTKGATDAVRRLTKGFSALSNTSVGGFAKGVTGAVKGLNLGAIAVGTIALGLGRATVKAQQFEDAMVRASAAIGGKATILSGAITSGFPSVERLKSDSVDLVASTEDLVGIFSKLQIPIMESGGSLLDVHNATRDTARLAEKLSLPYAEVAKQVEKVATGTAKTNDRLAKQIGHLENLKSVADSIPDRQLGVSESIAKIGGVSQLGLSAAFSPLTDFIRDVFSGMAGFFAENAAVIFTWIKRLAAPLNVFIGYLRMLWEVFKLLWAVLLPVRAAIASLLSVLGDNFAEKAQSVADAFLLVGAMAKFAADKVSGYWNSIVSSWNDFKFKFKSGVVALANFLIDMIERIITKIPGIEKLGFKGFGRIAAPFPEHLVQGPPEASSFEKYLAGIRAEAKATDDKSRTKSVIDMRGSKIEVKQDFRKAQPERVLVQMMKDIGREAERRTTSGFVPALGR